MEYERRLDNENHVSDSPLSDSTLITDNASKKKKEKSFYSRRIIEVRVYSSVFK